MGLNIWQVLELLGTNITISALSLAEFKAFNVQRSRDLLIRKCENLLTFRKTKDKLISFSTFNYYGVCNVKDLTGNQLLRVFVHIFNKNELFKPGNCVLFTDDGINPNFAICVIHFWQALYVSYEYGENLIPYLFEKCFDDKRCKEKAISGSSYSHFYEYSILANFRLKCIEFYPKFLQENINQIAEDYRHTFAGLLFHIAKTQIKVGATFFENDPERNLPLAAVIKFAILHIKQPEILQSVLGLHNQSLQDLNIEIPRGLSRKEYQKSIRRKKNEIRMQKVESIVLKALQEQKNSVNCYSKTSIDAVIDDVKKLYEIR